MEDEPLTKLRIDVAEMRGMLSQALGDHGQRLTAQEAESRVLHTRVTALATAGTTAIARIDSAEKAINDLENAHLGFPARVSIALGSVTGLGGLALALFNSFRIN